MITRILAGLVVASVAATAIALTARHQPPVATPAAPAPGAQQPADAREADGGAIRKSAREFADAFNKGDAKAIAALYAENAELRDPGGRSFVGRAAIEKA